MAAKLIAELTQSNPGSPVLFFFFRQIIHANHEPVALLRDWMDQLLKFSPPLQQQLFSYVENRRSLDSIAPEDLWKDLKMAFAGLPGRVFCVADALDEMDTGNDAFLRAIGALGQWRPHKLKVLITSRPVHSVELPLRLTPCHCIRLRENLVDGDINKFVRHTLEQSSITKESWKAIADAVPGRANGLFLYARLAMDAFLEPGAAIHEVLEQLPADLNVLYTDLLKEHAIRSGVDEKIQHLILQAVTHANRPLRLLELAEMIRVTSPGSGARDLKTTKDLIRAACGPLLEILADETVSVIHHSFTEYLKGRSRLSDGTGYPVLETTSTHAQLALACLRYLQAGSLESLPAGEFEYKRRDQSSEFEPPPSTWDLEGELLSRAEITLRYKFPFLGYALANWALHVNRSESSDRECPEVVAQVDQLLGHSHSLRALIRLKWPTIREGHHLVTGAHVAARMGLVGYTKAILHSKDIDAVDGCGRAPM